MLRLTPALLAIVIPAMVFHPCSMHMKDQQG
jgi:hypothetical protein